MIGLVLLLWVNEKKARAAALEMSENNGVAA
jgi:hypothetical protein